MSQIVRAQSIIVLLVLATCVRVADAQTPTHESVDFRSGNATVVAGPPESEGSIYHPTETDEHFGGGAMALSPHCRRKLADKHAPAGLMGDHVHEQGEFMVEYRYMNMYMEDNRIGTRTVSDAAVLPLVPGAFRVDGIATNNGATPTQMTMEMHMIHLMYGVTDDITAYTMIMLPSLTMDHIRGPMNPAGRGTQFTTHNSGIGDTTFGALVKLFQDEDDDIILNIAFSAPTGDIFRTSTSPTGGRIAQPLPYPMRLGSGTANARPGITWKHYLPFSSFGAQFQTDIPLGRNYRGYSVSDTYRFNVWFTQLLVKEVAFSLRLENLWRSNFDGADPMAPNGVISTNVESFRGGYWLNLGIGIAVLAKGHLFNVELVPTLYQDLDGVQLETDWSIVASWSKSF